MKHILNQYFDKIYCITVYDFYDRHDLVKKQLNGIEFDWIFSPPPLFLLKTEQITTSESSLVLGHLNCILNAKFNGYKRIAIWEDDGILTVSENDIKLFIDNIPENWDCLYMGNASCYDGICEIFKNPMSEYVNKFWHGTGSSFNAIQYHVYDILINYMLKMDRAVDFMYYKVFSKGNTFSPAKGYFCDPISTPNEFCLNKFNDLSKFIPSKIKHFK